MVLLTVGPQLFQIPKDFKLWQVRHLPALFPDSLALLAAHVAEVMLLAVVHVQTVLIVKVLVGAKVTAWMRRINVLLQRVILEQTLLEHQNGLVIQTQLAKVQPVRAHIMVPQLFLGVKLTRHRVCISAFLFTQAAVKADFATDLGSYCLVSVHESRIRVLNPVLLPHTHCIVGIITD